MSSSFLRFRDPRLSPLIVDRAGGFPKREASVCAERTNYPCYLFLARHLMLYWPNSDS